MPVVSRDVGDQRFVIAQLKFSIGVVSKSTATTMLMFKGPQEQP